MLGVGLDLMCVRPARAASHIRVVPGGDREAYAIAPHAELGAIALHLFKGNGEDASTPALSLGQSFGEWRIKGFRILPGVDSDPRTEASEIIYEGVGSQELAINLGGVFGGQYHGFGGDALYVQSTPALASESMVPAMRIESSGEIVWNSATATWSGTICLKPDGSLVTFASVSLAADPLEAYFNMTIVNSSFSRASLDGGETWRDLTELAINGKLAANVPGVILRNPLTGTTITITDDALEAPGFAVKEIQRRSGDYKIYPNINPLPAGSHLGEVTVRRTIVFGAGEPDPLAPDILRWTGAEHGENGYWLTNPATPQYGFADGRIVLTRGAGSGAIPYGRVVFPMAGLTIGKNYTIPTALEVSGSSSAGGATVNLSANPDGSSAMALGNAAAGTPGYAFTASAGTMYLTFHQPWLSGSDNVLRIAAVGPVVETP